MLHVATATEQEEEKELLVVVPCVAGDIRVDSPLNVDQCQGYTTSG